jgi:hypothetical protein
MLQMAKEPLGEPEAATAMARTSLGGQFLIGNIDDKKGIPDCWSLPAALIKTAQNRGRQQ